MSNPSVVQTVQTPFGNHPFVYDFQEGFSIKPAVICSFLAHQRSWEPLPSDQLPDDINAMFRIQPHIRDTLSARVHTLLYQALAADGPSAIPWTFPSQDVLQSFYNVFERRVWRLYPCIHPKLTTERTDTAAPDDYGILLAVMLVLGCLASSFAEACSFAGEMAYLIRMSINERAARDESYLANMHVVGAWVLQTIFSTWSGVKMHAELAEAFHGAFATVG